MFNFKHLLWIVPVFLFSLCYLITIKNSNITSIDKVNLVPLLMAKTINSNIILDSSLDSSYDYNLKKQKRLYIDTLVTYPYTGILHLDTMIYYLNKGVKEKTGHNDGPDVAMFLHSVGAKVGDPWCAAFFSYALIVNADFILFNIRSALAQNFITKNSIKAKDVLYGKYQIPPGSAAIFKKGQTYKGHIGSVYIWDTYQGQLIEGNTGNKISFMYRTIEPRNYFRIVAFTLITYIPEQQEINDSYEPKWYYKTDNLTTNGDNTR